MLKPKISLNFNTSKKTLNLSTTRFLILISIAFNIISCNENSSDESALNGTYNGKFNRLKFEGGSEWSLISITFNDGLFRGSSRAEYPLICNGTYVIEKDQILFKNLCDFSSDSDSTYILEGRFKYQVSGRELFFEKNFEVIISDYYELELE
ncbi:MAG: hypothetical protein BalsKO_08820 [Balneolaceae bacterium]